MSNESIQISCPHCWETLDIAIEIQIRHLVFVEDCEVCCNPMRIEVFTDEEGVSQINVVSANE
jgi:hypothetical protein